MAIKVKRFIGIEAQFGSEFQLDVFEGVLPAVLEGLKSMEHYHKENKISYKIHEVKDDSNSLPRK